MPKINHSPRNKRTLMKSKPTRFKSQPVNSPVRTSNIEHKLIPINIVQDKESLYQ